jgi:hypothetical protein
MDRLEASNLSPDEEFDHWWVMTRFHYVEQVLALAALRAETLSVIEFGCGTGQNLRFCWERSRFRKRIAGMFGVDPALDRHQPALAGSLLFVLVSSGGLSGEPNTAAGLGEWLVYMVGPPLIVYVLGWSVGWITGGLVIRAHPEEPNFPVY